MNGQDRDYWGELKDLIVRNHILVTDEINKVNVELVKHNERGISIKEDLDEIKPRLGSVIEETTKNSTKIGLMMVIVLVIIGALVRLGIR